MKIRVLAASVAAGVLSFGLIATGHAAPQNKMAPAMKPGMKPAMKPAGKMASPVYVCAKCKEYMSPMMAKKMGYKDPMGHKLMKMSKAPAGYMDASKMPKDHMGGMNKM